MLVKLGPLFHIRPKSWYDHSIFNVSGGGNLVSALQSSTYTESARRSAYPAKA